MDTNSLDDLASFGSEGDFASEDNHVHGLSSLSANNTKHDGPSSPSIDHISSPLFDPVSLSIGPMSPGARSFASDRSSHNESRSHESGSNFYVNAVHMHIQENAKIPNYNKAVDRSNSSNTKSRNRSADFHSPAFFSTNFTTINDVNLETHDKNSGSNVGNPLEDFSMAEMFLSKESNYRKSLNQNYEHVGSLGAEPGAFSAADEAAATAMEIDALTAAIDPTPWAEIEHKIHKEAQHHPHQSSYYPYGRHHQLPIPERVPSPPRQEPNPMNINHPSGIPSESLDGGLAQALATAAALAAVSKNGVAKSIDRRRFPASSTTLDPARDQSSIMKEPGRSGGSDFHSTDTRSYKSADVPCGIVTTSQPLSVSAGSNTQVAPRHFQRQRANSAAAPAHSAAHSTERASVLAAASQKSQYGFGGDHIVPSVPAPPPTRVAHPNVIDTTGSKSFGARSSIGRSTPLQVSQSDQTGGSVQSPTDDSQNNNSGVAYERKKQRAKDARVKLNDSIDRLSIAISLAGSQSAERMNQLQHVITNTNSTIRQKTIQSNQECLNLAEQAKKWDRPSFVGTAASLIQSLNGQCEALMAEIVALQDNVPDVRSASISSTTPTPESNTISKSLSDTTNNHAFSTPTSVTPKHGQNGIAVDTGTVQEPPAKRARVVDNGVLSTSVRSGSTTGKRSDDEIIFSGVSTFLDPLSLCRSQCVSNLWKRRQCFFDEQLWLNLLVRRFGSFNVRQWRSKTRDVDDAEEAELCHKDLYQIMHTSNVMPHVNHQEGTILKLGETSIKGKVSGWLFMVERSNGETLRSVKSQPGDTGNGRAYQSRPVVELKIVVQNTGMGSGPVVLKDQNISVDISTRRTGGNLFEIGWDDRFRKVIRNLDGTMHTSKGGSSMGDILCSLGLFEAIVLDVHIQADGCSTTTKFQQKGNFAKLFVKMEGRTETMVIPFSNTAGIDAT